MKGRREKDAEALFCPQFEPALSLSHGPDIDCIIFTSEPTILDWTSRNKGDDVKTERGNGPFLSLPPSLLACFTPLPGPAVGRRK